MVRRIFTSDAVLLALRDIIADSAASSGAVRLTRIHAAESPLRRLAGQQPVDFMGLCRENRRVIVLNAVESRHRRRLFLSLERLPRRRRDLLIGYGRDGAVR